MRNSQQAALWLLLGVVFATGGCDQKAVLRAKQVTRQDELIGGPSAKGKLGDFLLENGEIRAIVGGPAPGWAAGVFGGTLLDVDRARWQSEYRNGKGLDAFSEAFPMANLLLANPAEPRQVLKLAPDQLTLQESSGSVRVLKDGSDGQEAVIRVEGHSAYIFDALKFLNKPLILQMVKELSFGKFTSNQIIDLAASLLGVNIFGLINRLQISLDFSTDYVLKPGDSYLTMRTTVTVAPPDQDALGGCAPIACDLDCPYGYAMREQSEPVDGRTTPFLRECPVCACATQKAAMPTFNESRDFFKILLGDNNQWKDPAWKGGMIAGDFLFFGTETTPFTPGWGFDIDRRIYENMWQGVGTLGSPFAMDWLAGTSNNVSYAWATKNPDERALFDCPTYRLAIVNVAPDREDAVAERLVSQFGLAKGDAASRIRVAVVNRTQIPLQDVPMDAQAPSGDAATIQAAFDAWAAAILAGPQAQTLAEKLGDGAQIGLIPAHACLSSKVLVPLLSTSATVVLTHFSDDERLTPIDNTVQDDTRSYTFERYLFVGDGDVGSVLRPVYAMRGTPTGDVSGVVIEESSSEPLSHINVFVLADPRANPATEAAPLTFREYRALAAKTFGHSGFVSQMQTDRGLDTILDGAFDGPVPPGRYFVVAHARDRGSSALVPIVVTAGQDVRVNLTLPAPGRVAYRIVDDAGQGSPARLSFIPLDAAGLRQDGDGMNDVELGDPRYDQSILKHDFTVTGDGVVPLPPGRYDVVVSRGIEYGIDVIRDLAVIPGQETPMDVLLRHEVDTTGYLAGDFHVHARNSVDSSLPLDVRVKAAIAEGLEVFTSSDHDHVTDYLPYVLKLGVERLIRTEVGMEVSPLEYGHYNGFPVRYDDTKTAVHDPAPWQGLALPEIWAGIRARADAPQDAFVLQLNHPRGGFLGLFDQVGMKAYDLERVPPGMEMCNAVLEQASCDFDSMEVLNGKTLQYIHTPTVAEVETHNVCYREIVAARDAMQFPLADPPENSVCGRLQSDPTPDCDMAASEAAAAGLSEDARTAAILKRDHCQWHRAFRDAMSQCTTLGLLDCKRQAMEALKFLSIRYMIERTPEEQSAFFATTPETDVGCNYKKALAGCQAKPDTAGKYPSGCSKDECVCETCVCATHPECCQSETQGGTGWTDACAASCRNECLGCELRPCTDRSGQLEDWFALMDAGQNKTAMANSDSHGLVYEIGLPRNYVAAPTDRPAALGRLDVNRAIREHRVIATSGPFIDFSITNASGKIATVGEGLDASAGGDLSAHIRILTPSWFKVDRVEVYRNSRLERRFFPDRPREDIVDFDETISLGRPSQDSWYTVVAYGINDPDQLTPVYKRAPYGEILTSTLISLAAQQLLASFGSLVEQLKPILGDTLDNLTSSIEMPDSYPILPWAVTNQIRVDIDGGGFLPTRAVVQPDGSLSLPPFCSRPCLPVPDEAGKPTRGICGLNQFCVPDGSSTGGVCKVPIPEKCVGLQKTGVQ